MLYYNIIYIGVFQMKKLLTIATLTFASQVVADTPNVISSIYPLQQIANAVTGKTTNIIADSYLPPHNYSIKPSEARKIKETDIVLWIGEVMMPQLSGYINNREGLTITASKLANIKLLKGHEHEHGHEHEQAQQFSYDPHIWLDTHNAQVIAKALAKALIEKDPQHRQQYQKNLDEFEKELQTIKSFIYGNFESNPAPNYFVFHNAYSYFETEFGIKHAGEIRLHARQTPATKHLNELKKQLKVAKNACIFREPQFDSPIIDKLVDNTDVKISVLNPIGYEKDKNIGYTTILKNIALRIANCRK